jgi:acyl dehydratase
MTAVGDQLPEVALPLTATHIAAGAIATRDFMPVHHDRDYANAQGAPDIFMNILSTNAYCTRYLTDWAGPEAIVRKLAIRLGVPVFPGTVLRFSGTVTGVEVVDGEEVVDLDLTAATDLGDHATGTARLTLPA